MNSYIYNPSMVTFSIFENAQSITKLIPSFCTGTLINSLNIPQDGNCRSCLVEFEKIMKPQVACCLTITNNLIFYTTGPFIFKIRENIFEFLMINHSLCCPVCDQGFDCDLQDEIKLFSSIQYRFKFKKQSYTNLFYTLFTTTYFNRCIRCTKCDRFELMISNKKILGTLLRGLLTEVNFFKKFIKKIFYYQSNIVDICPVSSFN